MPDPAKILVVEDEGLVARDLSQRLHHLGYAVPSISLTGEGALELADSFHPDLVLMDINLKGGLDGIAAAERLRRQHDIPVVFLTAYSDAATLNRAKRTEPYGYLLKPFMEPELLATVEMALFKHREDRRQRRLQARRAAVMQHAPDGIVVLDPQGEVVEVNPAAERMLGRTELELLRRDFRETVIAAEWQAWFRQELADFRKGDSHVAGHWTEITAVRADGSVFPGELALAALPGEEAVHVAVYLRDITRRRRFEQELDKMIRGLQSSLTHLRTLRGLITICAACKSIRDPGGNWHNLEHYLMAHTAATFSHGYCPDCLAHARRELGLPRPTPPSPGKPG